MPALGLTDHGVMNGAVEHYKACRKHGIKPILGLEAYLVDDRRAEGRVERNHLTLLAANDTGFRNLVKLTSAGFLEGFKRGKANVDMELLERHADGVIALTGCLQSRFCRRLVEERPDDARAHLDDLVQVFGADDVYFEVQENGIPEQAKANEGIVRYARELGRPLVATADVHYLRPRGLPKPRGAALRADQVDARAAEADLRHQRVLPQERRRDGGVVRGLARSRCRRRSRSPSAATSRSSSASCCCRASRRPTARSRGAMLRRLARRGAAPAATATRPPAEARRAARLRARGDRRDGLRVLLPDRLGLRQLREGERGRGRPGPRLGGRLDRRLRAQHHRPRPARQRPAVRALPQPGAQVDARHRHRLLGPRARARDPLRAGEVRARVGRPDHHLRQDGAAGGDPRRGPRARLRLRHRRPGGEADPGADHGPQPELRGVPEARPGPAQGGRRRRRREADRRGRPGSRGDRPQQLDPRRRGGDRRPPPGRDRAAAAGRGSRRAGREGRRTASPSASTRSSPSTRWARSRRSGC